MIAVQKKIDPCLGLPAAFHALLESTDDCLRRLRFSSQQNLKNPLRSFGTNILPAELNTDTIEE